MPDIFDDTPLPEGLLGDRFEVLGLLGRGGQATTWRARDTETGELVALKELRLGIVAGWKAVELFEREGDALRALDHPAIPKYVHAFHEVDDEEGTRFFLAQELVEGTNLRDSLGHTGWDEDEAKSLMREVLDVLVYLHGLSPPVIHRDIKPSNLIRRTDGRIALIDFGAVQTISPETEGGSTVVGTHGYMPLEQYMGRAEPATDLYALGATVVHLLSRTHPSELDLVRSQLDFEDSVNGTAEFETLVATLLAPSVEDRFRSAERVLAELDALDAPDPEPEPLIERSDALEAAASTEPSVHRGKGRLVLAITAMMGVFGCQTMCFMTSPRCSGGDVALESVRECPAAVEALGDDIHHAFFGLTCANHESSGNCAPESFTGSGNGTMRVAGSEASGQLDYQSTMNGCGNWTTYRADLSVGDAEITIVPCEGGMKP